MSDLENDSTPSLEETGNNESKKPGIESRCHRIDEAFILRLTGADRQKWFHNFCTADIKKLEPGQGTEAFVLTIKGKTLAHAIVIASKYDLTIIVMGQTDESLEDHLNKYIITEDVSIECLADHSLWYMQGSTLDRLMEKIGKQESATYGHGLIRDRTVGVATQISGQRDWLLLVGADGDVSQWFGGIEVMGEGEFDRIRIGNAWPICGIDVATGHLPQEYQRDEQAISFTKGCYLGQETVARIDALGHVNYFFVSLEFNGEVAASGHELSSDGKTVGEVTSSVFDPATNKTLAVGFVRRLIAKTGAQFESQVGVATLV